MGRWRVEIWCYFSGREPTIQAFKTLGQKLSFWLRLESRQRAIVKTHGVSSVGTEPEESL